MKRSFGKVAILLAGTSLSACSASVQTVPVDVSTDVSSPKVAYMAGYLEGRDVEVACVGSAATNFLNGLSSKTMSLETLAGTTTSALNSCQGLITTRTASGSLDVKVAQVDGYNVGLGAGYDCMNKVFQQVASEIDAAGLDTPVSQAILDHYNVGAQICAIQVPQLPYA